MERYDAAKARFDEVPEAISAKEVRSERLASFIKMLKDQTEPVAEFDRQIWASMVACMTVSVDKGATMGFVIESNFEKFLFLTGIIVSM